MKKLLKYTACLAILLMVIVLFTGCKVTGGGWFMNKCGEETKCTFGFNAQGTEEECFKWNYKGQFQFNDHNGVKFHINEMVGMADLTDVFPVYNFTGYDKDDYLVNVTVTDMGEPGADAGDGILIIHDFYGTYVGNLGGGNIQIHKLKD